MQIVIIGGDAAGLSAAGQSRRRQVDWTLSVLEQVSDLDLCYAPPFAPVWDPVLQAANKARFAKG